MKDTIKAIRFDKKIHHKEVINKKEPWESHLAYDTYDTRYYIVDTETGEILDNAQGYGYKTAQKAYAAYAYKNRNKEKDKEYKDKVKHIKAWMKKNKSFVKAMDRVSFEIAKGSWGPDDKFDAKMVKEMLKEEGLEPDFSAYDLLKVWRKS